MIVTSWDEIYLTKEWGKYPYIEVVKFIARNFYDKNRSKINFLDVGCGTAFHVWFLAREKFSAFGIDSSKVAIEKGRKRLASENLQAELTIGDITQLPYENNFFDCVIDNECLYSNSEESTIKILKEIKRVLKNNGLFYSRTFSSQQDLGKNFKQITKFEFEMITEGPLAGNKFARLVDEDKIKELYGGIFNIESIDIINCTDNNKNLKIDEFQIICRNKKY